MQLTVSIDDTRGVLIYAAARPGSRCLTADVATAFAIPRHHVVKAFDAFMAVRDGDSLADLIAEPRRVRPVLALHPRSRDTHA